MKYKALIALTLLSQSALASDAVNEFTYQGEAASTLMDGDQKIIQAFANENLPPMNGGTLGLDYSSFLYKSGVRGVSSTTFEATLNGKFDSKNFHGQADLEFYTFLAAHSDFSVEAREAFISNQTGRPEHHQFTIGRRYYEWSKVDQVWDMMSLWSPRFNWDPIHPETIGLTGVFYNLDLPHDGNNFNLLAYFSPLAIPERGTNTKEENHRIVSNSPFSPALPTEGNIQGSSGTVPILYYLDTPPLQDILFRPNFAIKARYELKSGFWGSLNGGLLPVNSVTYAVEPKLNAGTGNLDLHIRPQFPMRVIYTAEAGYKSPKKDWDLWFSGSRENPFSFENQSNWLNPVITPATIISAGTNIKLTSNFYFNGSAIFIKEEPFLNISTLTNVNVNLPARFPLHQGFKLGGTWHFSEKTLTHVIWTQDLIEQSHLVSVDIEHLFQKFGILIGAGADVLVDNTTKGWLGQYYGDDRVRGWFKYAF